MANPTRAIHDIEGAKKYLVKHNLHSTFEGLAADAIAERPEDPVAYLHTKLSQMLEDASKGVQDDKEKKAPAKDDKETAAVAAPTKSGEVQQNKIAILDYKYPQRPFNSVPRVHRSQPLRNDRCQNILFKAVFEHFKETKNIAALLLTSKSFQNSSFGADFLINYIVDNDLIPLLEAVLSPSSCFSLQFTPSLHIKQSWGRNKQADDSISHFVHEIVKTKYLRASLRSLTLEVVNDEVLSSFFGSCSNAWPQLHNLHLQICQLNDEVLETIGKNALQLRTLTFEKNAITGSAGLEPIARLSNITSLGLADCRGITDASLGHVSKLSGITSLKLSGCAKITDAGLEHLSKLACISFLDLTCCGAITNAGLEHVSKLSGISDLNLNSCDKITDAGLEHLVKLSSITCLKLSQCKLITDGGLEPISKLSGLTFLSLSFCDRISDVGIMQHLSKLSDLFNLDLTGCGDFSEETKMKLLIALPNCSIYGL